MSEAISPKDRATHAEALRRNPLLTAILKDMRDDCLATWMTSGNMAQREEQWMRLKVIEAFEARIQRAIDDGKMAQGRDDRAKRARAEG